MAGRPSPLGDALRRWSRSVVDAIDATFFPSTCPICSAATIGSPICVDCRSEMLGSSVRPCPRCAMPTGPYADLEGGCSECRDESLGFDAAIALGPYQGPIRELCLRLKRNHDAWLGRWLARIWVEGRAEVLRRTLDLQALAPPLVVAIPQHWTKQFAKQFHNQADILAEELAAALGLPLARALHRRKKTPQLAQLSRTRRYEELRGAFSASPGRVKGRQILLVDDILTSGATCGAAARALKAAGAKRVVVAVIGRAEGRV